VVVEEGAVATALIQGAVVGVAVPLAATRGSSQYSPRLWSAVEPYKLKAATEETVRMVLLE
jgi:hypothetical protein